MQNSSKLCRLDGRVVENTHLQGDYYRLSVTVSGKANTAPCPGQFYQVKTKTGEGVSFNKGSFLYKPLSVYDYQEGVLTFMIKVIGEGTAEIAKSKNGEMLELIGPLGKGFEIDEVNQGSPESKPVLLVSGGIGYAPLYYLKKELNKRGIPSTWLHGGKTANDIFPCDIVCTDDGSQGNKGLVTNCLPALLGSEAGKTVSRIYCCGPKPMMKVVREYACRYEVAAYFSLEEYMACGIGVCLGCAVKKSRQNQSRPEYMTVCKDGPVFNGEEIDWNE